MMACTSPREMPNETPFRISRPSTLTRRSLISKSANFLPLVLDVVSGARVDVPGPGGAGRLGVQQALVDLLLVPAGLPGAGGYVLDRAIAVPKLKATVLPLDPLCHVTALARQPGQLADASFE